MTRYSEEDRDRAVVTATFELDRQGFIARKPALGPGRWASLVSGQVEDEDLGGLSPDERQPLVAADRRAVAFAEGVPFTETAPARDVDPGVARRARARGPRLAGRRAASPTASTSWWTWTLPSRPSFDASSTKPRRAASRSKGCCAVRRLEAARVGHDPDLQEVHGLRLRVVVLAVRDAGARAHELDLARAGSRPRRPSCPCARARPRARRTGSPCRGGRGCRSPAPAFTRSSLITRSAAEAHVRGVVVVAEREGVAAVEPAPVGAAALAGGSNP